MKRAGLNGGGGRRRNWSCSLDAFLPPGFYRVIVSIERTDARVPFHFNRGTRLFPRFPLLLPFLSCIMDAYSKD